LGRWGGAAEGRGWRGRTGWRRGHAGGREDAPPHPEAQRAPAAAARSGRSRGGGGGGRGSGVALPCSLLTPCRQPPLPPVLPPSVLIGQERRYLARVELGENAPHGPEVARKRPPEPQHDLGRAVVPRRHRLGVVRVPVRPGSARARCLSTDSRRLSATSVLAGHAASHTPYRPCQFGELEGGWRRGGAAARGAVGRGGGGGRALVDSGAEVDELDLHILRAHAPVLVPRDRPFMQLVDE